MISLLFIVWSGVSCVEVMGLEPKLTHEEIVAIINEPDVECIIDQCLCYEGILQPSISFAPKSNNVRTGATDTNYEMHFKCRE